MMKTGDDAFNWKKKGFVKVINLFRTIWTKTGPLIFMNSSLCSDLNMELCMPLFNPIYSFNVSKKKKKL